MAMTKAYRTGTRTLAGKTDMAGQKGLTMTFQAKGAAWRARHHGPGETDIRDEGVVTNPTAAELLNSFEKEHEGHFVTDASAYAHNATICLDCGESLHFTEWTQSA